MALAPFTLMQTHPLPFRHIYSLIAAACISCLSPLASEGAYVPGVTATTTMGSGFDTSVQNTVNAAGLSAPSLTATHAGTAPNNSWVSGGGVLAGTVTFNLRASLVVTGFSFWNQNGGGPGEAGATGIRGVAISYSTNGVTFTPLPEAPTQFNQVTATGNAPPQVVTFPGVLATHIRFQILSNYGDPGQTGFAEVAFNGAPNQPPTINAPKTITTAEDAAATFVATTADAEGDPDEPPVPVFSTPAKGTITGAGTNFTYTPHRDLNGSDSFTISARDVHGGSTTRTVDVMITAINDPPTFGSVPETLATNEDLPVDFKVVPSDVDGDPVTVSFADAAKGVITGDGGNYRYVPGTNLNGSDSFTITADDGQGGVVSRTVSVAITPVNDPPSFTSVPGALATEEDTSIGFNVAATDVEGDPVTFSVAGAARGTITGGNGTYRYVPNLNANGADSFTIIADDAAGGITMRNVSVTITPVNDAPTFATVPETLATNEDTPIGFSVQGADVDGDAVRVTVTSGSKGTVTGTGTSFSYAPNLNANGSDSFAITLNDGQGGTAGASVNVVIAPVNDAPVFTFIPETIRTSEDIETNFTITTSDVDNDPVTVAFSGASKGSVSGNAPAYTYIPNPGAAGQDAFTVTATDGQGGSSFRAINVRIMGAPTIAGRYALLLADEAGVDASLGLILSRRGFVSGTLREANGRTERFHRTVKLPPGERAAAIRLRHGATLTIEFDSKGHVAASLTRADRVLRGTGNVGVPPPANVPGRYTMMLDTGAGGFGWCVIVVTPRGSVRIAGKLPDGSTISASQGVPLDGENRVPIFLLGKRREIPVLSGSLHFATEIESDVTGALNFRTGANNVAGEASGALFVPANSALPAGNYPLVLSDEGVNLAATLTLNSDNTATVDNPQISLTPGGRVGGPANGLFSIRVRDAATPGASASAGTGVFIQKSAKGFGQVIVGGGTGQILIGESP